MNKYNFDFYEHPPVLKDTKCKLFAYLLTYGIKLMPLIICLVIWYKFNWFYGLGSGLFGFLVSGIVRAKLRVLCVPPSQFENNYSDFALSSWYVDKYLCN